MCRANVHEMAVACLPHLKDSITHTALNFANTHSNMENILEMSAQFCRQVVGSRGYQAHILGGTRFININIYCLRAKQDAIVAATHEIDHGGLNRGQRQRLLHHDLPEIDGVGDKSHGGSLTNHWLGILNSRVSPLAVSSILFTTP